MNDDLILSRKFYCLNTEMFSISESKIETELLYKYKASDFHYIGMIMLWQERWKYQPTIKRLNHLLCTIWWLFKCVLCHCAFCLSHCSGVKVFCSNAWISFSSSARQLFTILNNTNKKVQTFKKTVHEVMEFLTACHHSSHNDLAMYKMQIIPLHICIAVETTSASWDISCILGPY